MTKKRMKKFIYSIMVSGALLFATTSCEDSVDDPSVVTYFAELTLNGDDFIKLSVGDTYTEPGYTATEGEEDITDRVVISGTVELDIETMFRDGYTSLWEILAIMVAISAVYPKLSYTRSIPGIKGNLSANRVQITTLMQEFGYEVEHESVSKMTFRLKSRGARLARKYEDRVTFEQDGEVLYVEGLKKDLVRIISRMEYRLNGGE